MRRYTIQAEITVDLDADTLKITEIGTSGRVGTTIILSGPTKRSPDQQAVKNDKPIAQIFRTARDVSRFIQQSFLPSPKAKSNG